MSITINPPAGPWTVADLARLPDIGLRFEIHEGNLVMMSPVTLWHSTTMRRLANALESAGVPVATEAGVKRSEGDIRVPDVAVFHTAPTSMSQAFWAPGEIAIAIEIVSDSSQENDRFHKPRWYAHGGVAEYWRVEQGEHDEAVIYQYKLARTADGAAAYVESGVTTLDALERRA
jgi:Uma2 family endonuclease